MQAKLKIYLILTLALGPGLTFGRIALCADKPKALECRPAEAVAVVAQPGDIKIEQKEIIAAAPAQEAPPKLTGKGKSILKMRAASSSDVPQKKLPKTASEAKRMGWKQKSIKTPQPITDTIKEVPKELIEKEAKKKKLKQR